MFRRSLFALLASLVVLPSSADAQVDDILDKLKSEALGFARGCDYADYLEKAQQLSGSWNFVQGLNSWSETKKPALFVTDLFSWAMQEGSRQASMESARKQSEGLMFQLEQVCQSALQLDETTRIHRLYQAANFNIGRAVSSLFEQDTALSNITPGTGQESFGRDYASVYNDLVADPDFPNDTIYHAMRATMYSTLAAADDMLRSLETIQLDIARLRDELKLRATDNRANGTVWVCPEGYPGDQGFNTSAEVGLSTIDGVPICGAASPARSQQIMAQTEALKLQLMAIAQAAEARQLEVNAVALMADNQDRRQLNQIVKTAPAY